MTSKGPAVVRYRMLMTEQNAYETALSFDKYFIACLKLQGIIQLLPPEYKIEVPELPAQALEPEESINKQKETILKKWVVEHQQKAYAGISQFIKEEYKNIDSTI